MNNKRKRILKRLVLWSDRNILQIVLLGIIFLFTVIAFIYSKLNPLSLIDVTIISSFVITFGASIIFTSIIDRLRAHVEDDIKIDYNFNKIVNKYQDSNAESLYISADGKKWPMTVLYNRDSNINFKIKDSLRLYTTPREIINYSVNLIDLHKSSRIRNNIMIRLNNFILKDNEAILYTSRTTYINSLITNRAMDYRLPHTGVNEGLNVREMLEPGPYLNPLKYSKLSNHIGYNILIETLDNCFCFKTRGFNVSISKGTVSFSISTTLKTINTLNKNLKLTIESLEDGIKKDIRNSLNICVDDFDFSNDLQCIYRELYEGGKPQFLFYKKINLTKDELMNVYSESGNKQDLIFVTHQQFKEFKIDENFILSSTKTNRKIDYEFAKTTIAPLVYLQDKLSL